jgi:hypothetical protein
VNGLAEPGAAWVKLALMSHGMTVDEEFLAWFADADQAVRRRNFYNSPVWGGPAAPLPQEIRLTTDSPAGVVVAVNVYGDPEWLLTLGDDGPEVRNNRLGVASPVTMVPDLECLQVSAELATVTNLYGGSALSFFSPRACYFFADGTQCRFCSLDGTAAETEYANRLTPAQVEKAVASVLSAEGHRINQVMIVGGNERNLDRGFTRHVDLVRAAGRAIEAAGDTDRVSVHLVTMPPNDLNLISLLAETPNLHAGFNLEAWDLDAFARIAPGKAADYGQAKILDALTELRDAVGDFRAHSILIAGLEPPASTLVGAAELAGDGVSPIINAFHSDVHSALGLTVRPSYETLAEVAAGLSSLYDQFPIQPYWKGCGRNALDFEASNGLFTGPAPALGGSR